MSIASRMPFEWSGSIRRQLRVLRTQGHASCSRGVHHHARRVGRPDQLGQGGV